MPPWYAALTTSRKMMIPMTRLIMTVYSADLPEQPLPARLREEMRDHRPQPLDRRTEALVQVILPARFVGPVDQQRLAFDVAAGQKPPGAAVLRVVAVVPHDEVLLRRHRDRAEPLAHVVRRDLL